MKQKLVALVGWYGALAILAAYFLLSLNVLGSKSVLYQVLNLTGALGIAVVSIQKRALQPAFLNLAWTAIAVVAIVRLL